MASSSEESSLNSKEKYVKEKFMDEKRISRSHKYEPDKSRRESSPHSRRRSPQSRTHRDSSQERRDRSGNLDERKIHYTDDRRIVYRSEDRTRERYKPKHESSYHSPSYDDRHVSERNPRASLEEKNDHHKANSERLPYVDRFGDTKSSERSHRMERLDHHRTSDDRSPLSDRIRDVRSSDFGRSSEGMIDHHKVGEETFPHHDRHGSYNSWERDHEGRRNPNDERHITYRNPSKAEEEEFIASLLQKIDFLSNQVDYLTQENEKLKHSVKTKSDDSTAEVSVTFSNKRFEEKFAAIIKELATDLITGRCSIEALTSFLESSEVRQHHSESWNPEGELFSLDISCEEPKESSSVPRYDTSFNEVLQTPGESTEENPSESKRDSKRFAKTCFNCDGDHFIGQCPHPLNQRKIANSRKKLRSTFVSNKRYHVCGSQESGFKPGIISDELKKALNLQKNQIPPYIYRMRVLDYPPGWLAEAVIESSGIALYGSDGIAQVDDKKEQDVNGDQVQYDPKKLIDYPGFNAPLPPDIIDESSLMGLPPMQTFQLRNFIEQSLPTPEPLPSRKRKLVLPEPKSSKSMRSEENMEVDDDLPPSILEFNPPLPEDIPPPPPPDDCPDSPSDDCPEDLDVKAPSQPDSDNQSGADTPLFSPDLSSYTSIIEPFKLKGNLSPSSGTASPSLRELEEMKKRLVIELGITAETSSPALIDSSVLNDDDTESLKTNPSSSDHLGTLENTNDLSNFSDSSFSSKASGSAEISSGMQRTDSVGSKLVSLGTPSISRHSSYSKLPNYDNFTKDVTTHLNFENLPNSTGTYEKMKKVIKKVKEKINSLMQ